MHTALSCLRLIALSINIKILQDNIMNKTIVVISGYFNPFHCGHLDYIQEAAKLGDKLIAIVNNDDQVRLKGSVGFMSESDRRRIIQSIKGVDEAILSIDKDKSVVETLEMIYDMYVSNSILQSGKVELIFANGGDRFDENVPEAKFCSEKNIRTVYNVGGAKTQSSSTLLESAANVLHKQG